MQRGSVLESIYRNIKTEKCTNMVKYNCITMRISGLILAKISMLNAPVKPAEVAQTYRIVRPKHSCTVQYSISSYLVSRLSGRVWPLVALPTFLPYAVLWSIF